MLAKLLRNFGFSDFFIISSVYTLLAMELVGFANDPGVGWHLATGDYILKNFSIPFIDPFLGGQEGRAWICDQWLADLILSAIL